jgi:DNA-directed RNA polymerase III subunit RPC1
MTTHPPAMPASGTMKEQIDDQVPKRITALRFGVFSPQAIINQSVLEVCERSLFDLDRGRAPRTNGPLDRRMGTPRRDEPCETCGLADFKCSGHFGHVRLALPAFHCGYIRAMTTWLSQICKVSGSKVDEEAWLTP